MTHPDSAPQKAKWNRGELDGLYAAQQPQWADHPSYESSRAALASAPALVSVAELNELRRGLATVALGGAQVLQIGDCAESFYETDEVSVRAKLDLLHQLSDSLVEDSGQDVVRVGRLGGQFAKPRSQLLERVGDQTLAAFQGHLVNSEEPTVEDRRHDPRRMVEAYAASARVLDLVRADRTGRRSEFPEGPWASHDALVVDYEAALVRVTEGTRFLASTHFPWIGDRTRNPESAQVHLLSVVDNPVACKVGPSITPESLRALCMRLDPDRLPGRLTLIVRLGIAAVEDVLPTLVRTVRMQGHPVVWLSDPMHGNTFKFGEGTKTRRLADMADEVTKFRKILRSHGAHPGGLHLETAVEDVTECIGGAVDDITRVQDRYTTLCDPRLNREQAAELVRHWGWS